MYLNCLTLTSYVNLLPNGYYDYDDDFVYKFIGKDKYDFQRINIIYARVSSYKQKMTLIIKLLKAEKYIKLMQKHLKIL